MAGADIRRSTGAPQLGHFFRCGGANFSIFSTRFPHFRHLYSYSGTYDCLLSMTVTINITMATRTARSIQPCAGPVTRVSPEVSHLRDKLAPAMLATPANTDNLGALYVVSTPIG